MKKNHFDKESEIKVAGVNAVKVAFMKRPNDIIKLYLTKTHLKTFAELVRFCTQNKRAYHVVENVELEKVGATNHHEGVVMVMKRKPVITLQSFLKTIKKDEPVLLLALENVSNPHNIGAIMRSSAHFGAKAILVTAKEPAQTSSAYRTAEGGAEVLDIVEATQMTEALKILVKEGFELVATSSHAKESLFQSQLSKRLVVVMGEERHGLSKEMTKLCHKTVTIPGSGAVESLNVSVATAIILGEYWSQNQK
ncbi:MAG: TrmH family RNA methyltransferase [Bacteriovoracaceae bacterium]